LILGLDPEGGVTRRPRIDLLHELHGGEVDEGPHDGEGVAKMMIQPFSQDAHAAYFVRHELGAEVVGFFVEEPLTVEQG
jgi:hypothetical protein